MPTLSDFTSPAIDEVTDETAWHMWVSSWPWAATPHSQPHTGARVDTQPGKGGSNDSSSSLQAHTQTHGSHLKFTRPRKIIMKWGKGKDREAAILTEELNLLDLAE